jgi:hypothetical protein
VPLIIYGLSKTSSTVFHSLDIASFIDIVSFLLETTSHNSLNHNQVFLSIHCNDDFIFFANGIKSKSNNILNPCSILVLLGFNQSAIAGL